MKKKEKSQIAFTANAVVLLVFAKLIQLPPECEYTLNIQCSCSAHLLNLMNRLLARNLETVDYS